MSGRNAQISRIYSLLNILGGAPHGLTVLELTARVNDAGHKADKRKVYRDLEMLSLHDFPLTSEKDSGDSNASRWRLEGMVRITSNFVLTYQELLALFLARNTLVPLRETPFYSDLESVFRKIEERLAPKHLDFFKELSDEFRFEPGPKWGLGIDPEALESIRKVMINKMILECNYLSVEDKDKKRKRRLGPHFLYFASGSIYLVAEDLDTNETKTYAVPRMSDVEMIDEEFNSPPVDPDTFFQGTLSIWKGKEPPVEITIEFSSKVAPFVKERRWHNSQRIVSKGGGSIDMTMELSITPELIQWIMGFGAQAFVREPKELQDKIVEETEKLRGLYPKKAA